MRDRRGQSVMEYTILIILVIGAFLTASTYVKRGIQGRWKASIDDVGEQYDPTVAISNVRFSMSSNTVTHIITNRVTINGVEGIVTNRVDSTNSQETKTGATRIDTYF